MILEGSFCFEYHKFVLRVSIYQLQHPFLRQFQCMLLRFRQNTFENSHGSFVYKLQSLNFLFCNIDEFRILRHVLDTRQYRPLGSGPRPKFEPFFCILR